MAYNPYGNTGFGMQQPTTYYPQVAQMPVVPQPQPMVDNSMIWVDGEAGAKAFQMNGQRGPIALWDINDTVIFIKSINQMGMPNPLQKIRYQVEDQPAGFLNGNMSGANDISSASEQKLRSEIDSLRGDIREMKDMLIQQRASQNRNQNNQNRGGNQNA